MTIRFTRTITLEVVTGMEGDTPITEDETFQAGEETEIDICDEFEPPFASEIQFGDGDVAFVTPEFWAVVEIKM